MQLEPLRFLLRVHELVALIWGGEGETRLFLHSQEFGLKRLCPLCYLWLKMMAGRNTRWFCLAG